MPDFVTTGPSRNSPLKTKAEKRAEAKAARARAQALEKRRRTQAVAGAAVAVIAVVVGLVLWIGNSSSSPSASAPQSASAPPSASAPSSASFSSPVAAAFPPLPEGADPALKKKPAATAGSGDVTKLTVTTLIEGKGAVVRAGQTIDVNYVGVTHADGKEFDASWNRKEPFSFQVGVGQVIPGWDQGLVGVKVGSRVQLDIPADMAYGENATGGGPAGDLRFVVDVLAAS
ncbi:FKBP-type peptidyl-prolyl cis-trans isomerase [Actinoplanes missouriensis]|uniref:FKBP-type peptidyl-prolyl cis-trans isomerase n=1 Tax=Actinoplanes missouriensis TaxID=1866 RepID=UPI00031B458C|nr:FKBP-type peptidyl-prolyl cis-trans isomerase [Actinoplanes missouriensis]